tara:strand:- start:68 stop:346 length:279 start_codon:yes stop_codon:yes gene_type:complete
MAKSKPMYLPGDLVELARFGQPPEREEDRVYATVIESLDSSGVGYHVPRYKVRLLANKKNDQAPFGNRFESDDRVVTILEYDLLPAAGEPQK